MGDSTLLNQHTDASSDIDNGKLASHWYGIFFILLTLTGFLWAALVPLGGYNDEWTHARYAAALVRGQLPITDCDEPVENSTKPVTDGRCKIKVPKSIVEIDGFDCLAFNAATPDSCIDDLKAISSDDDSLIEIRNAVANYPPLYYALVGWPTLFLHGATAWYAMRALTSIICAILATIMVWAVQTTFSGKAGFIALAALTPVTMTYFGAVNPQGVEILAAGALAATIFTIAYRKVTFYQLMLVSILLFVLVCARPAAILWAFLIVVATIILCPFDKIREVFSIRHWWIPLSIGTCGVIFQLAWTLINKERITLLGTPQPNMTFQQMLSIMLENTPKWYVHQIFGLWGWSDNPLPTFLWVSAAVLFTVFLVGAIILGTTRERISLVSLLVAIPCTAVAIQYMQLHSAGIIWAARYSLPLLLAACIQATINYSHRNKGIHIISILALSEYIILLGVSAYCAVQRYAVGIYGSLNPLTYSNRHQILLILFMISITGLYFWCLYPIFQKKLNTNRYQNKI